MLTWRRCSKAFAEPYTACWARPGRWPGASVDTPAPPQVRERRPPRLTRPYLVRHGAELAHDAGRERLVRGARDGSWDGRQGDVVDRADRHDLAHRGGDEGFVRGAHVVQGARRLRDLQRVH